VWCLVVDRQWESAKRAYADTNQGCHSSRWVHATVLYPIAHAHKLIIIIMKQIMCFGVVLLTLTEQEVAVSICA